MVTPLLAGHEPTATALARAFPHLLANPAALAALRDEIGSGARRRCARRAARLSRCDREGDAAAEPGHHRGSRWHRPRARRSS
ncbi:MAG TPA: hypothetical protein VFD84_19540 [Candidatus Binatia bacterium]|nr:hypothetical protein [Candidatus Binatia bacterium]